MLHHWAALDPAQAGAAVAALTWARTFDECDLDAVNEKTGLTPLHRALMSDNTVFALALVEAGANPQLATAKERRTPLDMCRDENTKRELLQAFTAAQAAQVSPAGSTTATTAAAAGAHQWTSAKTVHQQDRSTAAQTQQQGGEAQHAARTSVDGGPGGQSGGGESSGALTRVPSQPGAPPSTHSAPDSTAFQPLAKRRLVLPDAAASQALNVAWTRVVGAAKLDRRSPVLLALAFGGVPPALRAQVYFSACGAAAARDAAASAGLTYDALHARLAPQFLPLPEMQQIDKDVRRSGLKLHASACGALRRMLRALALTCGCSTGSGGYTQSMNSLAAMCLVLWPCDEEAAFWALFSIVHIVQPAGMYAGDLAIARCEAASVAAAVLRLKPRLAAALRSDGDDSPQQGEDDATGPACPAALMLSSPVLGWLMCAFVGCVPLELALRIWDVLLLVGPSAAAAVAACLLLSGADAAACCTDGNVALALLMESCSPGELAHVLSAGLMDDIMQRARTLEWPPVHAPPAPPSPAPSADDSSAAEARLSQGASSASRGTTAETLKQNARRVALDVKDAARGAFAGLRAKLHKVAVSAAESSKVEHEAAAEDDGDDAPVVVSLTPHEACCLALRNLRAAYIAASPVRPGFDAALVEAASALGCTASVHDAQPRACDLPACLFTGHVSIVGEAENSAAQQADVSADAEGGLDDGGVEEEEEGGDALSPHDAAQAEALLGSSGGGAEALRALRALLDASL